MKVIIAGSRHMPFEDYPKIALAVKQFEAANWPITEVVCGMAKGADTFGMKWAVLEGKIPVAKFPADWNLYGKGAGPIRNAEMADYADGLIAFIWDNSRGTANMIQQMQNRNKPCLIVYNGEV